MPRLPGDPVNPDELEFHHRKITGDDVYNVWTRTQLSEDRFKVSVQKEHLRPSRLVDSINDRCSELTPEERERLIEFCQKFGGRLPVHIYRLLNNGRSEAEKIFGRSFLDNYDQIVKGIKESDE